MNVISPAAVLCALPGAICFGVAQESWVAALAAHTVLYVLFCIELNLEDLNEKIRKM